VSGRFGTARVHLQPSLRRDRLIFLVKTGYQVFIGGLISSFVGYIALDLLARRRRRFPATRRSAAAHPQPEFERLSLDQRIQHWLLMASFITLMVTGLPLTSPSWAVSRSLVRFLGGMGVRAIIHRTAAVVLIGLVCYHLLYVLFSRRGYRDFWQLRPTLQDGRDLLRMLRFYLGYSTVPARFGRYNYIEKFEYLAVGWGSVVMVTTGLLLWAPGVSLSVVPKWVMDVALVVHGWEAILAFLAIIIWHMYNVHWNPAVFPMSRVWLTGRISLDELRDNHPLEYDRMQLGGRLPQEDAP
jgi:cytochrome b subunit of formate dehydrogenase